MTTETTTTVSATTPAKPDHATATHLGGLLCEDCLKKLGAALVGVALPLPAPAATAQPEPTAPVIVTTATEQNWALRNFVEAYSALGLVTNHELMPRPATVEVLVTVNNGVKSVPVTGCSLDPSIGCCDHRGRTSFVAVNNDGEIIGLCNAAVREFSKHTLEKQDLGPDHPEVRKLRVFSDLAKAKQLAVAIKWQIGRQIDLARGQITITVPRVSAPVDQLRMKPRELRRTGGLGAGFSQSPLSTLPTDPAKAAERLATETAKKQREEQNRIKQAEENRAAKAALKPNEGSGLLHQKHKKGAKKGK